MNNFNVNLYQFNNRSPQFLERGETDDQSLLAKNSQLSKARPSIQTTNRIIKLIAKVFSAIRIFFNSLIGNAPVNLFEVASALRNPQIKESAGLVNYLERFIQSDTSSSPQFKECVSRLQWQLNQIEDNKKQPDEMTRRRQGVQLIEKLVKEVHALKPGEMRLIVVDDKPGNQLFFLFTKGDHDVDFKVIGRGEHLVELSGVKEAYVAGKVMIPSSIHFSKIPDNQAQDKQWLGALLAQSMMQQSFSSESFDKLTSHLTSYKQPILQFNNLTTKTEQFSKVFWTALKHARVPDTGTNPWQTKVTMNLLKLETELKALFDLFNESADTLVLDSQNFRAIESMLILVSREIWYAYEKGYLSRPSLEEIVPELTRIQEVLCKQKKVVIPELTKLGKLDMSGYLHGEQSSLGIKAPIEAAIPQQVSVQPQVETRPPLSAPVASLMVERKVINPIRDLGTAKASLDALVRSPTMQSLLETIYQLDFAVYTEKPDFLRYIYEPTNSFWYSATQGEAIQIMEQLNNLSDWLVRQKNENKTIPLDAYEVLLKMSAIVLFLNTRYYKSTEYGDHAKDITKFIEALYKLPAKGFMGSLFGVLEHEQYERTGHRLHPLNAKTVADLSIAARGLSDVEGSPSVSYEQAKENMRWSVRQLKLIKDTSSEYYSSLSEYYMPSKMDQWMRHIKHPFLAFAYRNVNIHIGDHPASGTRFDIFAPKVSASEKEMEKQKHGQHLLRKFGMRTQEAIYDDPEQVANHLIDDMNKMIKDKQTYHSIGEPYHGKMPHSFSREEMRDLLLLAMKPAHMDIISFMEKHPLLMNQPEVRNYIDMLFFDRELILTLNNFEPFRNELPESISSTLKKLEQRIFGNKPEHHLIPQYLYLIDFSERLNSIYIGLGIKNNRFYLNGANRVDQLLINMISQPELSLYQHQILTLDLSRLLKSPSLSANQINKILLDYLMWKSVTGDPLDQDPHQTHWIEWKYKDFLGQLAQTRPAAEHYQYVLDSFCSLKNKSLDRSKWTGRCPYFRNDQYEIDLSTGKIGDLKTDTIMTMIPDAVFGDPLFKETFKDLAINTVQVNLTESYIGSIAPDSAKIILLRSYRFTDQQGNPALIEEEAGKYRFYRSFPSLENRALQAVSLNTLLTPLPKGATYKHILPYIFEQQFYIDPRNPLEGYSISALGAPLFKVVMELVENRLKIKGVVDLRDGAEPTTLNVVSGMEIKHPAIEQLASFEDPSQILIWGRQNIPVKIELPRYGLSFEIKDNRLFCLNPQYKDYTIDLSSTSSERKGLPFSLLLVHETPEKPRKLLFPAATAILQGPKLDLDIKTVPHIAMSLRPYTSELYCEADRKVSSFLDITRQAIRCGNFEQALQLLKSLDLKKGDLTKVNIESLVDFLRQALRPDSGEEAALKLKFLFMIRGIIKKNARHAQLRAGLNTLAVGLFKTCLTHSQNISSALRLTGEEFVRVSRMTKKRELDYFQKHLYPFFIEIGETIALPFELVKPLSSPAPAAAKRALNWDEVSPISKGHFDRNQPYSLDGFNPHSMDTKQCITYFFPLYKTLREKSLEDPNFKSVKWSLKLMQPKNMVPQNLDELLHYILTTVMKQKAQIADFPPPPELIKKERGWSSEFDQPVSEFTEKVLKLIPFSAPASAPLESSIPIPQGPFNNPSDLFDTYLQYLGIEGNSDASELDKLEQEIRPEQPLTLERLKQEFTYREKGPELLYTTELLSQYFEKQKIELPSCKFAKAPKHLATCEQEALKNLNANLESYKERKQEQSQHILTRNANQLRTLQGSLKTWIEELKSAKVDAKQTLNQMLFRSDNPVEQAAIMGKIKAIATDHELMLAMLQGDLALLKHRGLLPGSINCDRLKETLLHLYDCEVKINLSLACHKKLSELIVDKDKTDPSLWENESSSLYALLSCNRRYNEKENPELLLFELFSSLVFRQVNNNTHQLQLLHQVLSKPTAITQAITGAGKTAVLSLLRGLMKANGENLVVQKVLPGLFNQTMQVMKSLLGDTLKVAIYPLRFDLKVRLVEWEKVDVVQPNGEKKVENKQVSLFRNMYAKMLKCVKEKGCIITYYKSIPLLEEKYFKLTREFLALRREGIDLGEMEISHWTYLRKILILLENRADEMQDEFDQPNRPIHRIQTQMEKAKKPAQFLIDESLRLYQLLLEEKTLLLKVNLQGDITETQRRLCIENVARKCAKNMAHGSTTENEIVEYLLGRDETVLEKLDSWTAGEKDILALYKDQFCTFLPLTLGYARSSRYIRSQDGKSIYPCQSGEVHEGAKFGSILEEINVMIQDYIQTGISVPELQEWINNLQKEAQKGNESANQRFREMFPSRSLKEVSSYKTDELANELNRDMPKVVSFLKLRLNTLMMSATVISMDPQNCVSMSKVVSGISATLGSTDSYHSQFTVDQQAAADIQSEMIFRLMKRTRDQKELIVYDPQHPEDMIQEAQRQADICAIIDGSAAFKERNPQRVAANLQSANQNLKQVGFYNESGALSSVGETAANIDQRGFYFSQAFTRGADIALKSDGTAILTVNDQGTIEDLNQQDGRLRQSGQSLVVARSRFSPEMRTVEELIRVKSAFGARKQAEDLFRAKKQELYNVVRKEARKELLGCEDLNQCLDKIIDLQQFFITPAASTYDEEGSYFAKNCQIRRCNRQPQEVLENIRRELGEICQKLELPIAVTELSRIVYSPEILRKMPEKVFAPGDAVETELELEVEEELEVEAEIEMEHEEELQFEIEEERELEVQSGFDVPYYLPRLKNEAAYQVSGKIHPAYDARLGFTDSFLPLSRIDPLYKRKPFDDKMYRVSTVFVEFDIKNNYRISNIFIGDLLDKIQGKIAAGFFYDIHTRKPIKDTYNLATNRVINSDEFNMLLSQIRFLDGQIDGYSDVELKSLREWLLQNGVASMRKHFEQDVMRNRGDLQEKYRFSQLWSLFEGLK